MTFEDALKTNHAHVRNLFAFMQLFGIDRFSVTSVDEREITAVVGWPGDGRPDYDPDEETQAICWQIDTDTSALADALSLAGYLSEQGLIGNDKITIGLDDLRSSGAVQSLALRSLEGAWHKLLSIRVDMVDEGRKTDMFFLHC